MSLDKTGAIPVDTHVWQIATKYYMPKLKQAKSLTDSIYKQIGDHFRSLYGPYAGWAHSVSNATIVNGKTLFFCSVLISLIRGVYEMKNVSVIVCLTGFV